MSDFSPHEPFDRVKKATTSAISEHFPLVGKTHTIKVTDVRVDDNKSIDDIRGQKEAKIKGRSWMVPVRGKVQIVHNESGKVVDEKETTIAQIPKITRRYSYIVDGGEWQVNNQFRLKSGVYARRKENGELESQWNLAKRLKGNNFKIKMNPSTLKLELGVGTTNVGLTTVLSTLGVSDKEMEKSLGKELFEANRKSDRAVETDIRKLHKKLRGSPTASLDEMKAQLRESFAETELRGDSTKKTLGKTYTTVDGQSLLAGVDKLLRVSRQEVEPDDRDSLEFKDFLGTEDFVAERIGKDFRKDVQRKLLNKLNRSTGPTVQSVISPDSFGKPIKGLFSNSAIADRPAQVNPMSFIGAHRRTTLGGEHGMQGDNTITLEAQSINPSHLGFLDPIQTPESARIGTILQMASAAKKDGKEIKTRAFNTKTGKVEWISPSQASAANVAFPDQFSWKGGKPIPMGTDVKVLDKEGDMVTMAANKVDYVLRSPKGMFDVAANSIPFLQNNSGNRTMVAAKQLEQAVPLVNREEPLVQVKGESNLTFERALGQFNAHTTPISGIVYSVGRDGIIIKDAKGRHHEVQVYDDFPLNDNKSVLTSTPLVKKGDSVKSGQVVADSNFTRNGTLAFGTNLNVAYMPYKGYNFEDGIVISESAAEKLTSEHMHRMGVKKEDNVVLNKKRYLAETAGQNTKDQADKLDDDGIIREGVIVSPGDILIGKLKEQDLTLEQQALRKFDRKKFTNMVAKPEIWDKDYQGEVVKVVRHGKDTTIYVKAATPAVIGDKIVGRHGNKGIITKILPDHEMPRKENGDHAEVLLNPTGIPCYDFKTQFLTQRGWIDAGEISMEDVFATVNPKTLTLEFQSPTEVYHLPYKGKMYHVENQQLDMLVTPNHKQFSARRGNSKLCGTLDLDDPELPSLFLLEEAQDIAGQPRRYLKAAKWEGSDPGPVTVPAGTSTGRGRPSDSVLVAAQDWAEFMGWFLSEGSCYFNHANYGYVTEISQDREVNWENYAMILALVSRMGFNPELTPTSIRIKHKGLFELLAEIPQSARNKAIPRQILDLPSRLLSLFLDRLMRGDGSETWNEETGHYGCRRYWTSSERLADGVQEVAAKLGIAANIKRESRRGKDACYYISLSGSRFAPWVNWSSTTKANQTEEWVDYEGGVHCATVPNGTLLVRRNGKAVFSGNTRMNLGQALETVATKIAEKKGSPYVVNNFDPKNKDYTRGLMKEMDSAGVKDREAFFDPQTGQKISDALTGKQYILKLHHTAEKGISARFRGAYDANLAPKKGGERGGQSMDTYGMYSLLAHGARENIREMQTVKSDKNDDYWTALQEGRTPPPPAMPFTYKKFEGYLRGMGVDVKKNGNRLHLGPLTDKQTVSLSNGELKNPDLALAHSSNSELIPDKGSVFDTKVTGTKNLVNGLGTKWSHFTLAKPMPNPTFETPIKALLGMTAKQFNQVMAGDAKIGEQTGPDAIVSAVSKIDVQKELKELRSQLPGLRGAKYNSAAKKTKYLRALDDQKLTTKDAYTMEHVPVMPPNMRPPAVLDSGDIRIDDISDLYRQVGMVNYQAKKLEADVRNGVLPEDEEVVKETRAGLYDGLKSLTLTGMTYPNRHRRGIAEMIGGGKGRPAKEAYFQDKVIGKKQDLSLRGVIVPEPSLGVDEVMIPEKAAREIYKPFIVRRMVQQGWAPGKALQDIKKNGPMSKRMLELELENRPLFLKRDPVLHKHGVQAFKPRLTKGNAIKIHPLATSGYNADFDGDHMSAFAPISQAAVVEAYGMLPSRNLFSPSTGSLMLVPSQESMLGLHQLSRFGKETQFRFRSAGDAARAASQGKISLTDVITIDDPEQQVLPHEDPLRVGKLKKAAASVRTTVGRVLLNQALPEPMRDQSFLKDRSYNLTKARLRKLLDKVGKEYKPGDFARTADRLKDMGNTHSTGFSFGLDDLAADTTVRDRVMASARRQEKQIRASTKNPTERKEKVVEMYTKANNIIQKAAKAKADKSSNRMYEWVRSGARGSWDQYRQMTVAPMQVVDSKGNIVPAPIDKSFSEGLDTGSYWASMYGARMGTIGRVKGTQEPGTLLKEMMQTSMNQLVTEDDCGTSRGLLMSVTKKDALDRVLAVDVKLGSRGGKNKGTIPRGTTITPEVISRMRNNNVKDFTVRTPLKCEVADGVCAKCFGINEAGHFPAKGINLGVIAAHSLGEPLTQMAMNAFHTGGVAGAKGSKQDKFERVKQLVRMPDTLPGSATLATIEGAVQSVQKDKITGGHNIFIGGKRHFVSADRGVPLVRVGQPVRRGDSLSDGPKNPKELLGLTNISSVQRYLTDELGFAFGHDKQGSNIHKRNSEVFIRALTNLSVVTDPGDHPDYMVGDRVPTTVVSAWNSKLPKGKRQVVKNPLLKSTSALPLDAQTDWMARLQHQKLKRTITDAAAEGWYSDVHGNHPIPAMAWGVSFGKGTPAKPWLY